MSSAWRKRKADEEEKEEKRRRRRRNAMKKKKKTKKLRYSHKHFPKFNAPIVCQTLEFASPCKSVLFVKHDVQLFDRTLDSSGGNIHF